VFPDKDDLCTYLCRRFVCNVSLTAVHVKPVKGTVQSKTVFFRWIQSQYMLAEVVGADSDERVLPVVQVSLVLHYHMREHLQRTNNTGRLRQHGDRIYRVAQLK